MTTRPDGTGQCHALTSCQGNNFYVVYHPKGAIWLTKTKAWRSQSYPLRRCFGFSSKCPHIQVQSRASRFSQFRKDKHLQFKGIHFASPHGKRHESVFDCFPKDVTLKLIHSKGVLAYHFNFKRNLRFLSPSKESIAIELPDVLISSTCNAIQSFSWELQSKTFNSFRVLITSPESGFNLLQKTSWPCSTYFQSGTCYRLRSHFKALIFKV